MTLIVALPQNDPALAEAAIAGGADALQLSLDAKQGLDVNDVQVELKAIIDQVIIPVGVSLKEKKGSASEVINKIKGLNPAFINFGLAQAPEIAKSQRGISKILSLGYRFTIELVLGVNQYGVNAVAAAIIPASGHGKELIVSDLQNYISIVISSGLPVLVPTQRSIRPSEVAIISDAGAKGLILTPVVTGKSAKHIKERVLEYRVAVDDLGD